ncbi:DUF6702 family protein [Pedobacter alpinus]|uniref:DUF6702 family protein n=1 Tax=Pedobacter alpinus TaxID=1590643 RepID=A0ABW5TRV6_9SPHI
MLNIIFLFLSFFHPYYVSVTEVNHNVKNKTLEISVKIFFDDLEQAIEKENSASFYITKPSDKVKNNFLIENYIKKHLQITVNKKQLPLKYIGYEIQQDAAWCYLEIAKVTKVNQITINNNVLYNLHKEQINMLNVTVNNTRKSFKLDAPKSSTTFDF